MAADARLVPEAFVFVAVVDFAFTLPAALFDVPLGAAFRDCDTTVEPFFDTVADGRLVFLPAAFSVPVAGLDSGFAFAGAAFLTAGFAVPTLDLVGFAFATAELFEGGRLVAVEPDAVFLGVEFFFVER